MTIEHLVLAGALKEGDEIRLKNSKELEGEYHYRTAVVSRNGDLTSGGHTMAGPPSEALKQLRQHLAGTV